MSGELEESNNKDSKASPIVKKYLGQCNGINLSDISKDDDEKLQYYFYLFEYISVSYLKTIFWLKAFGVVLDEEAERAYKTACEVLLTQYREEFFSASQYVGSLPAALNDRIDVSSGWVEVSGESRSEAVTKCKEYQGKFKEQTGTLLNEHLLSKKDMILKALKYRMTCCAGRFKGVGSLFYNHKLSQERYKLLKVACGEINAAVSAEEIKDALWKLSNDNVNATTYFNGESSIQSREGETQKMLNAILLRQSQNYSLFEKSSKLFNESKYNEAVNFFKTMPVAPSVPATEVNLDSCLQQPLQID